MYGYSLICAQAEQLTTEISIERSNAQKIDAERSSLDRQNKDLRAKISELDTQLKSNKKATVQALESRIANLEDQLETETRCVLQCSAMSCHVLHNQTLWILFRQYRNDETLEI
jgi:septal ring factor EnvC (AmiA/AmiB activator)